MDVGGSGACAGAGAAVAEDTVPWVAGGVVAAVDAEARARGGPEAGGAVCLGPSSLVTKRSVDDPSPPFLSMHVPEMSPRSCPTTIRKVGPLPSAGAHVHPAAALVRLSEVPTSRANPLPRSEVTARAQIEVCGEGAGASLARLRRMLGTHCILRRINRSGRRLRQSRCRRRTMIDGRLHLGGCLQTALSRRSGSADKRRSARGLDLRSR